MRLDESIEEAKILKGFLQKINEITYVIPKFRESEVALRAETLRGFIAILQNDVFEMIQDWQEESSLQRKQQIISTAKVRRRDDYL